MAKKERAEQWEEIVFEKRNKTYGAYFLRKIYNKHLNISLAISATILLLAVTIPLVAGYMNKRPESLKINRLLPK